MQKQASIRSVDPVDSLVRRSLYALKMRAKTPPSIRFKKMVTVGLIDSKGRLNRSSMPKMTLGDLMLKNQRAQARFKMKFPKSEFLGTTTSPDGHDYRMSFRGENDGLAVITGPRPTNKGGMVPVPEVYRVDAKDAADARAKLAAWRQANGWT
jgi:hypothetical protein